MTIKSEISLENFQAWSGGKNTLNKIINEGKCDEVESMLEELYPDGMTDTELNDLLWFESETVLEWVGIRTYNQIKEELDNAKAELENLQSNYEFDISGQNITIEKRQEIYELYYEDDIEELQEKIASLEKQCTALMLVIPQQVEEKYKDMSRGFKKMQNNGLTVRGSDEGIKAKENGIRTGRNTIASRWIAETV